MRASNLLGNVRENNHLRRSLRRAVRLRFTTGDVSHCRDLSYWPRGPGHTVPYPLLSVIRQPDTSFVWHHFPFELESKARRGELLLLAVCTKTRRTSSISWWLRSHSIRNASIAYSKLERFRRSTQVWSFLALILLPVAKTTRASSLGAKIKRLRSDTVSNAS